MHNFWDGKCFPCIIWVVVITIAALTVSSIKNKPTKKHEKDTTRIKSTKNLRRNY